jgi:hypothetical protein
VDNIAATFYKLRTGETRESYVSQYFQAQGMSKAEADATVTAFGVLGSFSKPGAGGSGASQAPKNGLLNELAQQGVKHTPENVVAIAKDAGGKIVFLEKGSPKAGLQHIVEQHGSQFARQGIAEAQIPEAVMAAVTRGKQVGCKEPDRFLRSSSVGRLSESE